MQDLTDSDVTWVPPQYDLSKPPLLTHTTTPQVDPEFASNFARWAKWCPDGSCALAQCENRTLQFLGLPSEVLDAAFAATAQDAEPAAPRRNVFTQPAPILDFAWYPAASPRNPATFCFVASVRDCPVKLLDATDGRLRASYRIVDHRERQVAPHALAFNATADKLYCGFEDAIEVFDVNSPGEGTRLHTTPNRKSRDGLKGIISALAFSADAASGVFAAGTLSPPAPSSSNIALFSEATGEAPVMFVGAEGLLNGTGFGIRASVSQLQFSPARPYLLYASFRRHSAIYCWDLRGDVSNPAHILAQAPSGGARTNQRLRFDIDIAGQVLGVGEPSGHVSLYDLSFPEAEPSSHADGHSSGLSPATPAEQAQAKLRFKAHSDAVGSVSFHPLSTKILTVAGSRHFDADEAPESASSSSDSDDDSAEEVSVDASGALRNRIAARVRRVRGQPHTLDNTAKLWSLPASQA